MRMHLALGVVMTLIALTLELVLARAGIHVDLAFAALISFALVLSLPELLILILISVLVLNWQPGVTAEMLVLAVYPLAVHGLRRFFHVGHWIENALAVLVGVVVLYVIVAPGAIIEYPRLFLIDLAAAELFVAIFIWCMLTVNGTRRSI